MIKQLKEVTRPRQLRNVGPKNWFVKSCYFINYYFIKK
jgi:hypothetical protein